MTDKETEMFTAAILASETKSLSENGEGGPDKETNTDPLKSNARENARVTKAHRDARTVEPEASPENRTLLEIFDRDKSAALDFLELLSELIPNIEFDGWFEHDPATEDNRPMRELGLAKQLCDALENLECVKLIVAKEV